MKFCCKIKIFLIVAALSVPFLSRAANVLGFAGGEYASVGIYIKDLQADTVVFADDEKRGMIPASVMKAVTSATAMCKLPNDFNFETRVYLTGDVKNGVLDGDVLVKASGDPTLESEFFPKRRGFINDIINALKAEGIKRIKGDVVLARVVEGRDYAEGPIDCWAIDDVCWAYGAGIFDFNYADNYYGLYPATGKTSLPAPNLKYTIWSHPWGNGTDLIRGIYSDSLIVVGADYAKNKKARVNTSMSYPFDMFRANLKARLAENNVSVDGGNPGRTNRSLLLSHKSANLDDILRSLMLRSDNMFAEGMLRITGDHYGDRYNTIDAEKELWSQRVPSTPYMRIMDGSGLSRGNLISAEFLGGVLEWMARSDMASRYVSLFPVSGVSGTLRNFMAKTPYNGRLALKTGSMGAVQSYAGYMLDDNNIPTHVVVIMVNNFHCKRSELRETIADFISATLPLEQE